MELHKIERSGEYEFTIKGRFTFADNQKFKEMLEQLRVVSASVRNFSIDFAGAEFMDSAAIGMLLLANDEAKKLDKQLTIKNLNGQPKKIFDISKLHDVFNVV